MTRNKKESETKGKKQTNSFLKEIELLEGREKITYDVSVLKSQIKNVNYDIQHLGSSRAFENKIDNLRKSLEQKEIKLKEYDEAHSCKEVIEDDR